MLSQIKKLSFAIALVVILAFLLFLTNELVQFYASLQTITPDFALAITLTLGVLILSLLVIPFIMIARLPKPIQPPQNENQKTEFEAKLARRLKSNRYLISIKQPVMPLDNSVGKLNEEANRVIRQSANTVFIATAVSQNGKLDALSVLISQTRLVWQIAHLYYQRPSLSDLTNLYANVGTAVFLAGQIEDLDISDRMEPIIRSLFKSMTGRSIPVIGDSASIIMDSLLEGSTNAFLTLRVGILARNYCSGQYFVTPGKARLSAFREASGMLGDIALRASKDVISGIIKATKNTGAKTIKGGFDAVKRTGSKFTDQIVQTGKKYSPFSKNEEKSAHSE